MRLTMPAVDIKKTSPAPSAHVPLLLHGVVALVDDDIEVARGLATWFELCGLQTAHYSCSESLLQGISLTNRLPMLPSGADPSRRTELVAAVVDLNLPGMSGFELATALRSRFPELPLVIITALREEERLLYGSAPSSITCLQKPFDLAALDEALFPATHSKLFTKRPQQP